MKNLVSTLHNDFILHSSSCATFQDGERVWQDKTLGIAINEKKVRKVTWFFPVDENNFKEVMLSSSEILELAEEIKKINSQPPFPEQLEF